VSKITAGARFVRALATAILGAAALIGFSSQAIAAEAEEDEAVEELSEVRVTGTRIQSPNVTAANPVTSVTGEELRQLGIVNVADALTLLVPQNISTYMPSMIGDNQAGAGGAGMETLDRGSFFIGNTVANLRGMDPVFGTRTLTLIDGRRVVSTSNQADVVDMNIIPSNLLQRMDVVTGGASATYGSGAMAGVVNLVLNNRMSGFKVDMDYGVNEAGDGSSPHLAVSGGTSMFDGRAHALFGVEWQKDYGIEDCATARRWCAESRALFTNNSGLGTDPAGVASPLPGFEGLPARFEMNNVRFSQFAPTGTVLHNNSTITSGYRFTDAGTDIQEYAYGFRGGTGQNVINGDGPLATSGTPLRPDNERRTLFTNFEFDFTDTLTGYVQGNYARTDAFNRNRYTTGNYCARFNTGQGGTRGSNQPAQAVVTYGAAVANSLSLFSGGAYSPAARTGVWAGADAAAFLQFLGLDAASVQNLSGLSFPNTLSLSAANYISYTNGGLNPFLSVNGGNQTPGIAWPFWVPVQLSPNPPSFNFNGNAVGNWVRVRYNNYDNTGRTVPTPSGMIGTGNWASGFANDFWVLDTITLTNAFDIGSTTVLPQLGRNAYAFLNNLSPEALYQVQNGFGNSATAGGGPGVASLYSSFPCGAPGGNSFTAIRKVWNPQVQQFTTQQQETMRGVAGVRGRLGGDWRWETYYQYGRTESASSQHDVATNLRLAFALDAVIDDREGSDTFGQPICRIVRDGVPVLDSTGRPLTDRESLSRLVLGENYPGGTGTGCRPLNLFGNDYSSYNFYDDLGYDAEQTQRDALAYAFVETSSGGTNSLQTLSLTANGTLWSGWAGPLTGAFGVELREDSVSNKGSAGDFYLRADLARTWADAFGGKTRVAEGFTELDMPLVSGLEGINRLSLNLGARYSSYHNKGGAGTTGESATQGTMNWKAALVFEPFDFARFRMTRSRDVRAAGYRELFLYQPGIPDEFNILNPWRERTAFSTENQNERYGQVLVGNANLKTEKSDTLTLGVVLSPGGWAQGMRLSVDYFDIDVKDAINVPLNLRNPVRACWEESGNRVEFDAESGEPLPTNVNDRFRPELASCRELSFAELLDANGNSIPGSRDLQDLLSYNSSRPVNGLPYKRRGIDVSLSYGFALNRMFESAPGTASINVRGTRGLESSGYQLTSTAANAPATGAQANMPVGYTCLGERTDVRDETDIKSDGQGLLLGANCLTYVDLNGQIRSSVFIPGVAASPKWTGSVTGTYLLGNLTTSLAMRYIGGAVLDKSWSDSPDGATYVNAQGQFLNGSVDNNFVKPYMNFSLNGSYNLSVASMKQFQVFGSINNLFDKTPPFTGGGISGATAQYHDTYGRAYRFGVRMQF
jgi:outer membrane receptor protein involved in Fe transport